MLCWDEDREDYIDSLVAKLGKVPGVARALAKSKQGADWLRTTWMALGDVLEINGTWDDEQRRLAHALLDTPAALVQGSKTITAESDTASLAIIVKQELDRIDERLRRYLLAMDDAYRSMAAAGMPREEDAETKRLRKQEARLKLDYRRAKAELLESRAQAAAAAAGPPPAAPAPEPPPVVASVRPQPAREPAPTPRPKTSQAAFKYLLERSELDSFDLPETATSPAQKVHVRLPFPGGDPQPQPDLESEPEPEFEPEPELVLRAEPAAVQPQTACVASHASRAAAANKHRDRDRKSLRDQQKKARKAARRNR